MSQGRGIRIMWLENSLTKNWRFVDFDLRPSEGRGT